MTNNLTFDAILKNSQTLKIQAEAKDWKDAVRQAVALLVKAKIATADYADAIIAATEEFGPYYVIADQVVMPHAKTGAYNLADGFSLLTLKKPVLFGDAEASVIICLSGKSPDFHISKALPQIAALFDDLEMGYKLAKAKTEAEIYALISTIDFQKYLN